MGIPERVTALEEIAADHEDRISGLEAEVAALVMLSVGTTERLDIQRVIVSSHSSELVGIAERLEVIAARIESALRVLARYRGFGRSQAAVLQALEHGYVSDNVGVRVLTEPLL